MKSTFGDVIKEALAINNMTQKQLAEKLNISPQTINGMIRGRTSMKIDDFCNIADILQFDPCRVFCREDDVNAKAAYLSAAIKKLDSKQQQLIFALLDYFQYINRKKQQ